jgi:hypothetical protein
MVSLYRRHGRDVILLEEMFGGGMGGIEEGIAVRC